MLATSFRYFILAMSLNIILIFPNMFLTPSIFLVIVALCSYHFLTSIIYSLLLNS